MAVRTCKKGSDPKLNEIFKKGSDPFLKIGGDGMWGRCRGRVSDGPSEKSHIFPFTRAGAGDIMA